MDQRKGNIRMLFAIQGEKRHIPLMKLEQKKKLLSQFELRKKTKRNDQMEDKKTELPKKAPTGMFLKQFEIQHPTSRRQKTNQSPGFPSQIPERRAKLMSDKIITSTKAEEEKQNPEPFSKRVFKKPTTSPQNQLPIPRKNTNAPIQSMFPTPCKVEYISTAETARGKRIRLNGRVSPRQERKMANLNTFLNSRLEKNISFKSARQKGTPQIKNINFFRYKV